jgi:hypothetical protein
MTGQQRRYSAVEVGGFGRVVSQRNRRHEGQRQEHRIERTTEWHFTAVDGWGRA